MISLPQDVWTVLISPKPFDTRGNGQPWGSVYCDVESAIRDVSMSLKATPVGERQIDHEGIMITIELRVAGDDFLDEYTVWGRFLQATLKS